MWKLSYRKRHENGLLPPPIKTVDSHTAPGSCHMSAFATWIIASQTHCAVNQTLCINYVGISNVLCPMCASQLATMTACIPMSYTYIIPTQSNLQRQSFCAPAHITGSWRITYLKSVNIPTCDEKQIMLLFPVYVCSQMCSRMCRCMWVSVWVQVEVRGQHGVLFLRNCLFVFVTGSVTNLGLTK